MLKAHFANVEKVLLAMRNIQNVTGHTLHKGSPREAFLEEFLRAHLGRKVALGTGEIIDANSKPGEKRPQMDIVVYKRDYPKLDFGGGISGFLAESVVSTIEVKSRLTCEDLQDAIAAAAKVKALERSITEVMRAGYVPPSILSYLVAYEGPVRMRTVQEWNRRALDSLEINVPDLASTGGGFAQVVCPGLDAIFVLGKGFVQFDNAGLTFRTSECRWKHPNAKWCVANTPDATLFLLFLLLTTAISGVSASWLDPAPYVRSLSLDVEFAE